MKTLPLNLNLAGMNILVLGGGLLAEEKVQKLLPYGPAITLVSPALCEGLAALVAAGRLRYVRDRYRPDYLPGFRLVFAATGDRGVHEEIRRDTRGRCCLLNTVDTPELCDFIMPAVIQGEHFGLAITTGGKAAGLARHLREELEASLKQEDGILELLDKIRTLFKRKHRTFAERRERLKAILRELDTIEQREEPS